jgi:hypothetical protein
MFCLCFLVSWLTSRYPPDRRAIASLCNCLVVQLAVVESAIIEIVIWRECNYVRGLVRIRVREFIPMTAGAACESGLNPIGQLSIPYGVPDHRSRQFRMFINDKPASSLGAIHSFTVYPIGRLYYKGSKRQCGRISTELSDVRCGRHRTNVAVFWIAIARRRRRPPVVRGFNGGPPALDDQRTKVTSARVRRNYASSAALFDAFSSREPASIPHQVRDRLSLENALAVMKTRHPAEVISHR